MKKTFAGLEIALIQGDITVRPVDVIVNAANSRLVAGGGVDGAIHRAAGPELQAAVAPLAPCPTGQARITPGFNLQARHVIFTVGPVYSGSPEDARLLRDCITNSLALAEQHNLASIAFPAISTGVYGYPLAPAASVILGALVYRAPNLRSVQLAEVVLFGADAFAEFAGVLDGIPGG